MRKVNMATLRELVADIAVGGAYGTDVAN